MVLVAVYIYEHDYLFSKPQVVNLGYKHFYTFNLKSDKSEVEISRVVNNKFINDFYGENVSLLSAIVGANGAGKTTVLSMLNKMKSTSRVIYVYEDETDSIKIENRTGKVDEKGERRKKGELKILSDKIKTEEIAGSDIPPLYYSAVPDIELNDFYSPLNNQPNSVNNFTDYYYNTIERNVLYLGSEIHLRISEEFKEIPSYNQLYISAKQLSKRDLRKIYGGFEVEGDIEKAQSKTLDELWKLYEFDDDSKSHLTNDGSDLLKGVIVNILSFLIVDATSMKTAYNGNYGLSITEMVEGNSVNDILNHFICNKIAFIDKYLFERVQNSIITNNYSEVISLIENVSINKEIDEIEKYTLRKIDSLQKENIKGDYKSDILRTVNEIEGVVNKYFINDEYSIFRENVNTIMRRALVPTSGTLKSKYKSLNDALAQVADGVKIVLKKVKESRLEIEEQITSKIKQAINLYSKIKSFIKIITLDAGESLKKTKTEIILNISKDSFEDFKTLISSYRSMVSAFQENNLISGQILQFQPSKKLSYGEKSMLNILSTFYDFSLSKIRYNRLKPFYLVLLDEADLGFHPLWKQNYVNLIVNILPMFFSELNVRDTEITSEVKLLKVKPKIQIVLTTHDPISLSDIPNYNVTYIKKNADNNSEILDKKSSIERPTKSFGANISQLISHSFFVDKGLIGDFARNKINEVITWLNNKKDKENAIYYKQIIDIVDEPVVHRKLVEMYAEKMKTDELKRLMKDEYEKIAKEFKNKFGEDI
jgi:predicted ATP-binding protein involved in virulence